MLVYCMTNRVNDKKYIGLTTNSIKNRLSQHKCKALTSNSGLALHNAIRKYGFENFQISILEKCNDIKELKEREIHWIKKLDTFNNGYNLTKGGDYNSWKFKKHSQETKEKISNALKNKTKTLKHCENIAKAKKIQATDEYKYKCMIAQKTRKQIMCLETNEIFPSIRKAAKIMKVDRKTLHGVLSGLYKQTGGYRFKYVE